MLTKQRDLNSKESPQKTFIHYHVLSWIVQEVEGTIGILTEVVDRAEEEARVGAHQDGQL